MSRYAVVSPDNDPLYVNSRREKAAERFLVQLLIDGELSCAVMTFEELRKMVSFRDCYGELEIQVYRSTELGKVTPLRLFGTWHDPHDPLLIELVTEDGQVIDSGYGEDH